MNDTTGKPASQAGPLEYLGPPRLVPIVKPGRSLEAVNLSARKYDKMQLLIILFYLIQKPHSEAMCVLQSPRERYQLRFWQLA